MAAGGPAGHPGSFRKRALDALLNLLFAAWVLHVLATGHLLPGELMDLLRDSPPVAVVVEPQEAPGQPAFLPLPAVDET